MNKSFTLIEILVVIVVIGVLSAFILVGMSSISSSANIAKLKAHANSLRNSLLTNLISEWKFDGSGVIDGQSATIAYAQDSWGINNGVIAGHEPDVRSGSNCVSGSCLQFTSANSDYINCGTDISLDIVNDFTLLAWIKIPSAINGRILYHYGPVANKGYYLTVNSSGTVGGAILASSVLTIVGAKNISNNAWHLVSLIRTSDGIIKIYVDAVSDATPVSGSTGSLVNEENLYIGQDYTGGAKLSGMVDEIRIFKEAASISEINQEYYIGIYRLFKNNGLSVGEYIQKLSELKFNLTQK